MTAMEVRDGRIQAELPPLQIGRIELEASIGDFERILPHDGTCTGDLRYQRFAHVTYTSQGQKVEVASIAGYRCDDCNLVILPALVSDELYRLIDVATANPTGGKQ